jgi:hypothetical protein
MEIHMVQFMHYSVTAVVCATQWERLNNDIHAGNASPFEYNRSSSRLKLEDVIYYHYDSGKLLEYAIGGRA